MNTKLIKEGFLCVNQMDTWVKKKKKSRFFYLINMYNTLLKKERLCVSSGQWKDKTLKYLNIFLTATFP